LDWGVNVHMTLGGQSWSWLPCRGCQWCCHVQTSRFANCPQEPPVRQKAKCSAPTAHILTPPSVSLSPSHALINVVPFFGLLGLPLQQCCPLASSPHVLSCGFAVGDPLPAECWFYINKVSRGTPRLQGDKVVIGGGGANALGSSEPLIDGDLVMLSSKAYGRYCSVSIDGALLCVSVQASNATRNLFVLGLQPFGPTTPQ
jgi:hypothetical protein